MRIELCNIEKSYKSPVIKNLSYTFEAGKLYVIKGVSGCGKTTLLNILGGVEKDFSGEIIKTPSDESTEIKSAFIFQQSLLIANVTVMDNLMLIKNDSKLIYELSERLGILDKLNKYPHELSGGERQRAAIVRALLQEPDVLLADEPTASLDKNNSENIVRLLAALKNDDRAVIVATHEHCFDDYADEILNLEYGVIKSTEKPNHCKQENIPCPARNSAGKRKGFDTVKYILKKNPKLLRPGTLLPLILVFFVMLLISTFQHNFSNEYFRFIKSKYPMDLIAVNQSELDRYEYRDSVKLYLNYTASENNTNAFYLPEQKYSVFSIDGMIQSGHFPENDNEILVSEDFIRYRFADEDYKKHLGATITFMGKQLKISGITANLSQPEIMDKLFADVYYRDREAVNKIFIPYETIKAIGTQQASPVFMGSIDGLSENPELLSSLNRALIHPAANQFYSNISDAQDMLNIISAVLIIILFTCYIMFCIFMFSVIQMELFYRKKELGYLQIFGLPKRKIIRLTVSEYLIRISASLLCAAVLYLIAFTVYGLCTGSLILFNPVHAVAAITSLYLIYCLLAYVSVKHFLKKSVISLITQ